MKPKFDIGTAFYKPNDMCSDTVYEVVSFEVHAFEVIYKLKVYNVVLSNREPALQITSFPSYYVQSYLNSLVPIQICDFKIV